MDSSSAAPPEKSAFWSARRRLVASLGLLAWLAIVISGPLTNPIYTEELTGPLGRFMAPLHQALYLGHGYRFFAPDPGPSHLVVYRGVRADGEETTGRFPHPRHHWPRLIYHRWFMLSETIFEEHASTPDAESFARVQQELQMQMDRFRLAGQKKFIGQIQQMADRQQRYYERATARIPLLVEAVARELARRHNLRSIELYSQERQLPTPADVLVGVKLDSPELLSEPRKIGEWKDQP